MIKITPPLLPVITCVALLSTSFFTPRAFAQNTASEADAANENGKKHFKNHRYLDAYRDFKKAADLSPEGRFFFNVCFSLNYLERYQEAIEACNKVEPNGADEKLLGKTDAVLKALHEKVPVDPIQSGNGGEAPAGQTPGTEVSNSGQGNATNPGSVNPPSASPDPFTAQKKEYPYEWSLGLNVGPIGSSFGKSDFYSSNGLRLNLFANFNLLKEWGLGTQALLSFASVDVKRDSSKELNIVDLGGLLFKHFSIERLDITPSVGLLVSRSEPSFLDNVGYTSLGIRGGISTEYALGANHEHVVSISSALNLYSGGISDSDIDLRDAGGLDRSAATLELMLGYEYRFTTPFSSQPLFTLE